MKFPTLGIEDKKDWESVEKKNKVKNILKRAIAKHNFPITEIISPHYSGVDMLGEEYASENNIPVKQFLMDWSIGITYIRMRNQRMNHYSESIIFICSDLNKTKMDIVNMGLEFNKNITVVYVY